MKLRKRKNHNVALVATARKMATIAWHMLRNRDPYRYAAPRSTETKLAKLRIMATRKRRRAGSPKGAKQPEAYGSGVGTRAIPSVTEACAKAGLPKPKRPSEISAGERRILQRTDTKGYFEKVFESRRVPRNATAQL